MLLHYFKATVRQARTPHHRGIPYFSIAEVLKDGGNFNFLFTLTFS